MARRPLALTATFGFLASAKALRVREPRRVLRSAGPARVIDVASAPDGGLRSPQRPAGNSPRPANRYSSAFSPDHNQSGCHLLGLLLQLLKRGAQASIPGRCFQPSSNVRLSGRSGNSPGWRRSGAGGPPQLPPHWHSMQPGGWITAALTPASSISLSRSSLVKEEICRWDGLVGIPLVQICTCGRRSA